MGAVTAMPTPSRAEGCRSLWRAQIELLGGCRVAAGLLEVAAWRLERWLRGDEPAPADLTFWLDDLIGEASSPSADA